MTSRQRNLHRVVLAERPKNCVHGRLPPLAQGAEVGGLDDATKIPGTLEIGAATRIWVVRPVSLLVIAWRIRLADALLEVNQSAFRILFDDFYRVARNKSLQVMQR